MVPTRVAAASFGAGLLMLAILPAVASAPLTAWIMAGFKVICHQIPDRSPELGGVQLAACHRCFGIYAGLLLGALLAPPTLLRDRRWHRRVWPIILLAALPAGLDWAAGFLGLWESGAWTRAATGAIFGIAGGGFILAAAIDLVNDRRRDTA